MIIAFLAVLAIEKNYRITAIKNSVLLVYFLSSVIFLYVYQRNVEFLEKIDVDEVNSMMFLENEEKSIDNTQKSTNLKILYTNKVFLVFCIIVTSLFLMSFKLNSLMLSN